MLFKMLKVNKFDVCISR